MDIGTFFITLFPFWTATIVAILLRVTIGAWPWPFD